MHILQLVQKRGSIANERGEMDYFSLRVLFYLQRRSRSIHRNRKQMLGKHISIKIEISSHLCIVVTKQGTLGQKASVLGNR